MERDEGKGLCRDMVVGLVVMDLIHSIGMVVLGMAMVWKEVRLEKKLQGKVESSSPYSLLL